MDKMGYTQAQRDRRLTSMQKAFPEASVKIPAKLIETFQSPDPNDRHVLAAAVRGQANAIITNNVKDFPACCVEEYGILCQTPDEFLVQQFDLNPLLIMEKLDQQAAVIRHTRAELTAKLAKITPKFADMLRRYSV